MDKFTVLKQCETGRLRSPSYYLHTTEPVSQIDSGGGKRGKILQIKVTTPAKQIIWLLFGISVSTDAIVSISYHILKYLLTYSLTQVMVVKNSFGAAQ